MSKAKKKREIEETLKRNEEEETAVRKTMEQRESLNFLRRINR